MIGSPHSRRGSTLLTYATIPGRFEALLTASPEAPAVILRRGDRRRVWVRAAVQHRAVRIANYCARRGLAADGAVAVLASGALDSLAAAWYVLATGRRLAGLGASVLNLDDEALRDAVGLGDDYSLRNVVGPDDPAVQVASARWTQAELLRAVEMGTPLPLSPAVSRACGALASGEPLRLEGGGLRAVSAV